MVMEELYQNLFIEKIAEENYLVNEPLQILRCGEKSKCDAGTSLLCVYTLMCMCCNFSAELS